MGRKPGGKNPPGHRAGGARPGAGRPRRTPAQLAAARYRRTATGPPTTVDEAVQTDGEQLIPLSALHPAYIPFINHPHDQGLIVLPVASALQLATAYAPQSIAHHPYPFGVLPRAAQDYQAYPPCHPPATLLPAHEMDGLQTSQASAAGLAMPEEELVAASGLPSVERHNAKRDAGGAATSGHKRRRVMRPTTVTPDVQAASNDISSSQAATTYEPVQSLTTTLPDSTSTPALESQPDSSPSQLSPICSPDFEPGSSHIVLETDQSTVQHMPHTISDPVHGESTRKAPRSRRRCVVCLQNGFTESSFSCPGRGERARCPRASSKATLGGNAASTTAPVHSTEQSDNPQAHVSSGSSPPDLDHQTGRNVVGNTNLQHISMASVVPAESRTTPPVLHTNTLIPQPAPMTTLMHLTPGYPSIAFYPGAYSIPGVPSVDVAGAMPGSGVHGTVMYIAPNEPSKRRPRRCIVCSATGHPELGFTCPGRGSRRLCKFYVPGRHSTVALSEEDHTATIDA